MNESSTIQVKVCCIGNRQEAQMALQFEPHALGLVGEMPSGPGIISDETIRDIAGSLPVTVRSFLLTSQTTAAGVIQHHQRTLTNTIQIVDQLEEGAFSRIRKALPEVQLVQVIHVIDESSVDQALQAAQFADFLLLDSGNPNLSVKVLGGTGKRHNWQLSRKICDQVSKPVFLAGGLNAQNVRQAIETVQPFGVDLCSGLRTDSKLDPQKLESFFQEIEKV